jgi:hypothetical protein
MKAIISNYLGLAYFLCGIALLLCSTHSPCLLSVLAVLISLPVIAVGSLHLLYKSFVSPFKVMRAKIMFALAGLVFLLIVGLNGRTLTDYEFSVRRDAMERFLGTVPITNGWLSSAKGQIGVPPQLADYFGVVEVNHTRGNHIQAVFEFKGGSALHHAFWYYDSRGDPPDARGYRRIGTCWYLASG